MTRQVGGRIRGLLGVACLGIVLLVLVLLVRPIGAGADGGGLVAQPVFGAPAARFLGASPLEAPGEVWALARNGTKIVRYTDADGWETVPGPFGEGEQPIHGLEFAPGGLAGRATPAGGLAVAAQTPAGQQMAIVRDPGGDPHAAPDPGELLHSEDEESLFSGEGPDGVLLTPVEEPGGRTGAFDVPAVQPPARQEAVLAFDGSAWSREPICVGFEPSPECVRPPGAFHVLAIDASGVEDAWLLAKRAAPEEGVELFQREAGGGPEGQAVWRQRQLGAPGSLGSLFAQGTLEFTQPSPEPPLTVEVAARTDGQPLTVTPDGVWVDAGLTVDGEHTDATVYYDLAEAKVTASWCDVAVEDLCRFELGAELPSGGGRSFAWPPDGAPGDPFGQREITGLGQGAVLDLEGTGFTRLALAGGGAGAGEGAALDRSGEGWLGASPPVHLTRAPEADRLVSWPVPFRRPLTAIAPQPGAPVAALGSEALAVGADGEVARYIPGQGWVPESLLTGSGARARPTLRGVAWPEPGRAYAVGDGAAMWVWQRATELWEPDPAEPPNLARANFTGIAFDPSDPSRGYAVGKQGLLLAYGRQWTQVQLPPGVNPEANFTSIAFAGGEAIATYKMPFAKNGNAVYEGGVLVDDGSGWRVDQGAEEALAGTVPERVAGLPDGGAAIASEEARGEGGSVVVERQGPGQPWQQAAGDPGGYPAALAAVREGGQVRAIVAVSPGQGAEDLGTDFEQVFSQPPPGGPPLLTSPYPLPGSGVLIRQTATGWRDEEHGSYPLPQRIEGQGLYDLPRHPDPMLALLIDPEGGEGWAVGGETGTSVRFQGSAIQTAGVLRYGPAAAPPENATATPLAAETGTASFAIGGNAQCAGPCADLSGTGIGPDVWLRSAVARATSVEGVRAFLYTGPSVASDREEGAEGDLADEIGRLAFGREEAAYARRLGTAAGSLPAFAAPAASDLDGKGSLATFDAAFAGFGAPLGEAPPGAGVVPHSSLEPGNGYYSFDSAGAGGTVRVIVLDYSAPTLGDGQSCWLAGELADAGQEGTPAIVVGDRDLAGQAPNAAQDAASIVPILVDGTPPPGCAPAGRPSGASAYFFDFPEQNRSYRLTSGGRSIPAFGSGTLGYLVPQRPQETDFVGASGFLVASVDVQARDKATNVAPVGVRLVPNIAALALDATDGTVLRRSHVGLFDALARRPLAGTECTGNFAPGDCEAVRPDPYVPIPAQCRGARCGSAVLPEYSFSSSRPDVADFVAVDPGSSNPRRVLLVDEKPVADASSGLLCAFNKGTTTVTVSTGGLSYSEKVTVLGGTAQRPCGTTPLKEQSLPGPGVETPPSLAGEPGFSPVPASLPPPPLLPAAPVPAHSPPAHQTPLPTPPLAFAPFAAPTVTPTPIVPFVPPPPVPAAQPTPPSGTSPVTEREEEVAYDLVHHMSEQRLSLEPRSAVLASSSTSGGDSHQLFLLPVLAGLAAFAGASAAGGRRRRAPSLVHQTANARRSRR